MDLRYKEDPSILLALERVRSQPTAPPRPTRWPNLLATVREHNLAVLGMARPPAAEVEPWIVGRLDGPGYFIAGTMALARYGEHPEERGLAGLAFALEMLSASEHNARTAAERGDEDHAALLDEFEAERAGLEAAVGDPPTACAVLAELRLAALADRLGQEEETPIAFRAGELRGLAALVQLALDRLSPAEVENRLGRDLVHAHDAARQLQAALAVEVF